MFCMFYMCIYVSTGFLWKIECKILFRPLKDIDILLKRVKEARMITVSHFGWDLQDLQCEISRETLPDSRSLRFGIRSIVLFSRDEKRKDIHIRNPRLLVVSATRDGRARRDAVTRTRRVSSAENY